MSIRYEQIYDGEWTYVSRFTRVACCDCGLVHNVYLRRRGGRLLQRVDRNERATAAMRRGKKVRRKIKELAKRK